MARSQVCSASTVRLGHRLFEDNLLRDTNLIPIRRKVCRPSDSEGQGPLEDGLNGHASPIALVQSFNSWIRYAHEYAIQILMNAVVQFRGGITPNFASPAVVLFRLTPVDEPTNPSCAFRLGTEVPLILQGEDLCAMVQNGQWEALDAACQQQAENIRAHNPHLCYAGSLPAMIHVEGTRIASFHPYPVYGIRPSHKNTGTPLDDGLALRVIFEHVVGMVIGTMNTGLVLHAPPPGIYATDGGLVPDVGSLVKRKKKWVWKKQEGWVWNRSVQLQYGQELLEPRLIWSAFYALCYAQPGIDRKHVALVNVGTRIADIDMAR